MKWFDLAFQETNPQEKIESYTKAVEMDPLFVEALFNLGIEYKKQNDYVNMERYLRRAFEANPAKRDDDFKFRIAYELANAYRQLGASQNYEDMLHDAQKFTADRSMQAILSFELGRHLYQQQRYQEAVVELKRGREFNRTSQGYFDNLITLAERSMNSEKPIVNLQPEKIRDDLRTVEAAPKLSYDVKPISLDLKLADIKPTRTETNDRKENPTTNKTDRPSLAREQFNKPPKATSESSPSRQSIPLPPAGNDPKDVNLEKSKNSADSTVSPSYVESLYQYAVAAMAREDWLNAVLALDKLQYIYPNYRDVMDRLIESRVNLKMADKVKMTAPENKQPIRANVLLLSTAAGVLIALSMMGFWIFSPTTRGRYYSLRSNYERAAQVYEKVLQQKPYKFKLYPELANLYLLLRRRDEPALRIYKTVLQLNLGKQSIIEEINYILNQRRLIENHQGSDSDSISKLEQALETELSKLKEQQNKNHEERI